MKIPKSVLLAPVLALPITGLVLALNAPKQAPKEPSADQVARGKYLVTCSGCNDCHTPIKMDPKGPEPDMSRMLSGHPQEMDLPSPPKLGAGPWFAATAGMTAWSGPWGISYAANLTPDPHTGLGIWTEEMFINTVLPPMPWQNMASLNDEDLKTVFAYLRSIPPIRNQVPDPVPPGGEVGFE